MKKSYNKKMAKEIPFRVSARTARLIGRENVSNAEAAVIELIKNCYDADSSKASLIFKEKTLYIFDDGHGMSEDVIMNNWMVIGTNDKELTPKSSSKTRIKSGAKGIGRFALDKLGKKVKMYTLPQNSDSGYLWSVEWARFDEFTKTVDHISASLEELSKADFDNTVRRLGLEQASSGTLLCIEELRDDWTEKNLNRLYGALESLVPVLENDTFKVTMLAGEYPDKYGEVQPLVMHDFDYKLTALYDQATTNLSVEIQRNELDIKLLEKKFSDVFQEKGMGSAPYDLQTFHDGKYERQIPITSILPGFKDEAALRAIGDFSFQIIFAKNAKPNDEDFDKYPYRSTDYSKRVQWMKRFGGIRIYRDNFRVRPYGEGGDDWLRLGERQAQSPGGAGQRLGGFRIRPNQATGNVYISRLKNESLQDKSSREGIVENDSFELLKNIIRAILGLLEADRNQVFYSLSELHKRNNPTEQIKSKGKQAVINVTSKADPKVVAKAATKEDTEALVGTINVLESQNREKDEEIKILRSLASTGIITAAAAHELKGFKNHLETRSSQLREVVARYIRSDSEELKNVRQTFNPYHRIDQIEAADKSIAGWLEYSLMPLRRDRRTRKVFYADKYFSSLKDTWNTLLMNKNIDLQIGAIPEGTKLRLFPIDLDTIFNNLIINSAESFLRLRDTRERKITVGFEVRAHELIIDYRDNGPGLDPVFKGNSEKIFLPYVTTKVDNAGTPIGTGMGMYLVKSVVDENGGTVEALEDNHTPKQGFGAQITLGVAT